MYIKVVIIFKGFEYKCYMSRPTCSKSKSTRQSLFSATALNELSNSQLNDILQCG